MAGFIELLRWSSWEDIGTTPLVLQVGFILRHVYNLFSVSCTGRLVFISRRECRYALKRLGKPQLGWAARCGRRCMATLARNGSRRWSEATLHRSCRCTCNSTATCRLPAPKPPPKNSLNLNGMTSLPSRRTSGDAAHRRGGSVVWHSLQKPH